MNENYLFTQEGSPRLFVISTWARIEQAGDYVVALLRDEGNSKFRLASETDPPDRKIYVNVGEEYFASLTEDDSFMLMLDGEAEVLEPAQTITLDFHELQIFDFSESAEPSFSDRKTFVTTHYIIVLDRELDGGSYIAAQDLAFVTADAVVHSLNDSKVGFVSFFNAENQAVKMSTNSSAQYVEEAEIGADIVWYKGEQAGRPDILPFESEEGATSVVAILDNEMYHQKRM